MEEDGPLEGKPVPISHRHPPLGTSRRTPDLTEPQDHENNVLPTPYRALMTRNLAGPWSRTEAGVRTEFQRKLFSQMGKFDGED